VMARSGHEVTLLSAETILWLIFFCQLF
jgi:hypothetical protein